MIFSFKIHVHFIFTSFNTNGLGLPGSFSAGEDPVGSVQMINLIPGIRKERRGRG